MHICEILQWGQFFVMISEVLIISFFSTVTCMLVILRHHVNRIDIIVTHRHYVGFRYIERRVEAHRPFWSGDTRLRAILPKVSNTSGSMTKEDVLSRLGRIQSFQLKHTFPSFGAHGDNRISVLSEVHLLLLNVVLTSRMGSCPFNLVASSSYMHQCFMAYFYNVNNNKIYVSTGEDGEIENFAHTVLSLA